jgi:hypothetical protein
MTHMTFSNNLLGDSHTGAYVEINPDRPDDPERFVDLISWNRNVIVSMNRTPNLAFEGTAEKINNVLHDIPYKQTSVYHDLRLNELGNYYSGSGAKNKIRDDIDETGSPLVYTSSNYFEGLLTGAAGEDNIVIWNLFNDTPAPASWFAAQPYSGFPHPTTPTSPQEAFTQLVDHGDVGAYQYLDDDGTVQIYRDSFDASQLEIVRNNQDYTTKNPANYVLPTIPSNTRPASYDTDHDGMADAWEIREFGDLSQSYRGDDDGDGYENIEEYMNQVDG